MKIIVKNRFTNKDIISNDYHSIKEALEKNKANLRQANLRGADLRGADLRRANLSGADFDEKYLISLTSITPEGDIIGYKKCRNGIIVKLLIPGNAKRRVIFSS